jgi:hypothetical protein
VSEAKQAEVIHVHLGQRRLGAAARADREGAVVIRRVHDDVDLAADLASQGLDGALVRHVERDNGHAGQVAKLGEARHDLPGLRLADPDQLRPGRGERPHGRLPGCRLAVRDQDLAAAGIAGQVAELGVIGQRNVSIGRKGDDDRLARPIERRHEPDRRRRGRQAGMQEGHDVDPWLDVDQADAPGRAFTEIEFLRVAQQRLARELASAIQVPPGELI